MSTKINCKPCLDGNCKECIDENCRCREKHGLNELTKAFTEKMSELLPKNIEELKKIIKASENSLIEYDVDKEQTIDSDKAEFTKDRIGGFDAYEEKNSMQHFSKDLVSNIMLPAHVYNGKESCGKWKITGCLQSDLHKNGGGYMSKGIMRCNNKGCRKCATSAIKREARAITNRLMTFCNLKRNRKIYLQKNRARILSHNIVSISHEDQSLFLTKDGRKKLREKSLRILKQFDIDGGDMIDHPYRFSKDLESARFSPHFHYLLTGYINGHISKQVYEHKDKNWMNNTKGWVVRNISTLESWKDCYRLSKYLLSHAAVYMQVEGKRSSEHSVRYFGECHNKKFKVEEVLKYSITGYDQLEKILYTRKEIELRTNRPIGSNEPNGKAIYPLQKVSYTHSIIEDSIKGVQEKYYEEYVNGNPRNLSKSLRRFIDPPSIIYPALPQSEPEPPSMEFLQMRFDYGSTQYDIVQSVYVNIILDSSIDCICPECTVKMETLVPADRAKSNIHYEEITDLLINLPEGVVIPIDDITIFDYLRDVRVSYFGMPYFDVDCKLQYDSGVYEKPECLDQLQTGLYCGIMKNIEFQKESYQFKINNGRTLKPDEKQSLFISIKKRITSKPLDCF